MKLLVESSDNIQTITEESESGGRTHFLSGIFMQAEETNKNGRMYTLPILEKETKRYVEEKVNSQRALGELNHPADPTVNLERVSHMVTELNVDGNHILGKAKVLDTPCGNIVRGLVDGGVKLGVSSRGVGSLTQQEGYSLVGEDFQLAAIDVVYDPSAPKAFVDMVMESVDWIWNEDTKSFLKKEAQVNEEKNVSTNPMPWFDTLVEMKTEIKTMQDKIFVLMNENKEMKTLLQNKVNSQVRQKEVKLEKLLEDTKNAIELSVKEKLRERREHETLKIFDNFLKEIAKN
jgi:hypothetical protein